MIVRMGYSFREVCHDMSKPRDCNTACCHTRISKAKKRAVQSAETVASYGGAEGVALENERLRKQLREREEEIEILQDALGFFAKRRKK